METWRDESHDKSGVIGPATFLKSLTFSNLKTLAFFCQTACCLFLVAFSLLTGTEFRYPSAETACNAVRKPAPLHELFSNRPASRIKRLV